MINATRILIVEDQRSDYELAQREIRKTILNCQFEWVEKEADFLKALKNFKPDVILSDYRLPQFDGLRVLEIVQQQLSFTPVIIWTGAMSEDIAVECMKQGAADYVIKENIKRLGPAVRHVLKEKEEILERRQAEERFQAIFENSPIGIFQSTPQGRFIHVNASMARIYGYASPQEMIDSITDISSQIYIDAQDRNEFTQLLQENNSVENFEMKNLRKDRSVFWTSTSARAVPDESGNTLYYEGFLQDITDRKLAESKLMESEARYRGIFENVQDAIFVESPEGNILEVNQRACEIFGYTRQEFLQKKVTDIVPSQEYIVNLPDVNLFPGQIVETINVRANGEHFPVEISGGLYELGDRSLFLVTLRDISERKQAEQQLRKQEQHFRALIENGMDNISLLARDGTLLWENPTANSTLGYKQDEFVNRNIFELMHPDDMAWTSELFAEVVQKPRNQQHGTFRLRHEDGAWRWMEATATNMLDEPSVNAVVINYRDVTERKLMENALREGEERYRLITQNSEDMIWTMDMNLQLTYVSPSVERALGYSAQEILSLPPEHFLTPESYADGIRTFAEEVAQAQIQPDPNYSRLLELEYRRKDGSLFWVEMKFSFFRDTDGHPNGILAVGRDMTERKEAERELRESQIKYRRLVETSHDLIWSVDAEGKITFINHAAKDIYGYEPEELIGHSFFEFLAPEAGLMPEHFAETISSANEYHAVESRVQHKDGRQFILSANSMVLRDEHGEIVGVTGTSRDITKRKEMEEALQDERNLLRTLIDNLPDRIYAFDLAGRKTLSNTADWKASGARTMEDVIGKTDFDVYPPELAEQFWLAGQEVLNTGKPLISVEEPGLDFDGNHVSILTTKIPLHDENGNVIGLVGVGRDITERKQAEAQIRDLLSLNEKMLNHFPLGILTYKLSGECIFANQNAATILGTVIKNLLLQNFHSIETWMKSGLYSLVTKAISTKTAVTADVHHVSTFGKDLWLTAHCVTFTSNDEEHVLLSLLDITERRQSEEKLIQSQQELTEAQRVAKIGSWSFDPIKNEVHWSEELYRIFGVDREKFAHTYEAFLGLIHPDDRATVEAKNRNALERGESFDIEYRIITPHGDVKTISEIVNAVVGDDKNTVSLFGTAQDITQRKQTEAERQALFEIMQGLAITNDLQEFLQLIHSTIAKVIYAENFFVVLHHPDTGLFEEIYSVDQFDPPAPPSRLEKSITSYVFRTGEPLLLKGNDFDELEARGEVELVGAPAASWLGIPLKTSNGTIGVIAVQDYQDAKRYSKHDKDFLASIATQVALAVERKQSELELQQKNEDLGLISVINEAIVRGQNLNTTIELLTKEMMRIFSTVGSTIYMLSPDKRSIIMEQYSFRSEIASKIENLLGFKIPRIEFQMKEGGYFHNVIVSKRSVITTDSQEIQNWLAEFSETNFLPSVFRGTVRKLIPQIYKLLNIKSMIAVPLISEQEVIGILDVSSSNVFTENDLKRIENIGEQLTAVLQRQQINEKVKKSEEFLQGVQDSLSAHVAILDQRGTIIRVNAAWREFGRQNGSQSPDHSVGLNYLDICDSVTGPEAEAAHQVATGIREVLAGKQKEASVEYACHSPQEKRWFTVHITCFDDDEQKWVILAHENITTRMIAEMALQESTAQLRTLFEATPDAIMLIDPHNDWSIVDCNSAACKINGYTRAELIGKPVDMLNTQRSTPQSNAEYFKSIQAVDVLRYETMHVHKDGTVFPIEVSTSLVRLGDRDMVLGIDRDIRERKRAEQKLRDSEERFRLLFENSGEAILITQTDGTIVSANPEACRMFGRDQEEIRKLGRIGIVDPNDQRLAMAIEERNRTGQFKGELSLLRKDGSTFPADVSTTLFADSGGNQTTSMIIRDITERRRAEVAEREQRILAEALRDTSEILSSSLEYGQVLDHILAAVGQVVPHDAATITLIEDQFARVVRSQGYEKHVSNDEITGIRLPLADTTNLRTMLETRQPVIVYDTHTYAGWKRLESTDWLRSNVGAPISIDGKIIGFVLLDSQTPEFFNSLHAERLQAFANQAAVAIHNANLLQQAQNEITERKRAEEALHAEQDKVKNYLDIAGVIMLALDHEGTVTLINQKGCEILGYSAEEVIGKNWINTFLPEAIREELHAAFQKLILGHEELVSYYENTVTCRDGQERLIAWHNTLVRDKQGTIISSLSSGEDITERKQAEAELRASEERFRQLADNIPEVFWVTDAQTGRELYASPATEKVWGRSEEYLLQEQGAFIKSILSDDLPMVIQNLEKEKNGEKVEMEYRVIHPDGSVHWIWDRAFPIFDENGKVKTLAGIAADVTERKLSEFALLESQSRYQDLFDNSPVALLEEDYSLVKARIETLRHDGVTNLEEYFAADPKVVAELASLVRIKDANKKAVELYRARQKEDLLKNLTDLLDSDSLKYFRDEILGLISPSRRFVRENQQTVFDGTRLEVVVDGSMPPGYEENWSTVIVSIRDVTERKQAETALQQSQTRYYDLFDSSPISLWEEDYSLVKGKIESLQLAGITDLKEYLLSHSNVVFELAELVKVVDVNRASLELYHASTKEDLLKNLLNFVSEEALLHLRDEVVGLISSEARFTWEGKDKTLDGQELTVMVNGSIAPGYEQTWSKVIVSIHDVTERKNAEERLRTSEERYHGLFQNLVDGFALHEIITDDKNNPIDYVFLEINPAFEKLTGLTSTSIIGRRATEVLPGLENEHFIPIYGQVALTGEPIHFEQYSAALNKYFEINAYSPRHGQFAVTFIDVTERKRSEKEIDRRAKETSALLETSLALTNLDSKAILQTIGNSARTLFAADGCRVFLMQPDDETLRCVMAIQENAAAFYDLKIKLGEGVTGAVAASGKAEIVNEMQNDPRGVQVSGTEEEEEAIMFAPLKERDRTIGVLSIRRAGAEHPFQPADLELLEAFASMAASAVSNARLFEQAQHRLDELEAIYENGLAVGQLLEPREIGNRVIETFANHLSWHHVTIRLWRPETDELEVIAFNLPGLDENQKIEMEHHFNQMISKTGQGLSGWVVQTGIPLRTGNVHANPQYVSTQQGIQSGLYMPLKIGDRTIGVISVESKEPDAFTEQDQRLLATLASQAAVAFENARLYQAAHQELLERTRAQAALWASETHYRELADSITDILFELDYNLTYTHWNKASEMFSGISAEDAIGKSIKEVWGEFADQLQREDIYRSVLNERQARTFEIDAVIKDRKQSLEIHAYPSTRGVSVVARDITERRLAEKLMEKRFELIEYSSQHATAEVMQKAIDEVSELTESHIGFMHFVEEDETTIMMEMWSTETLQGFCQIEAGNMHYPVDKAGVWADAIRQRRASIHNDYQSLPDKKGLPEGHSPVIRELVIPIMRGEKIVAVIGVGNKAKDYTQHDIEIAERFADYAWDIIERRQMEVALADERNQLAKRVEERTADLSRANSNLARALRVKDEFLANMSHELRTPLNAILGLSESLGEQVAGPLNEKQQKYLNTINESGHHLLSLINDILDLAKIEAGQITLDINKVDVNAVCQASLRMIKQLAQKKNQEVLFEIDSNVGWMWADERRLKQMIVNLLSNAVKFTPESGQFGLEVHGDEAANRVLITIWDKGIGISDQDMERLFKPFVQLDSGLAREATGTGLGLALVAQMARLHGGSVSVESQVGEGSRFTILLPWEPALAVDASTRLRNTGKFRAIDPTVTNRPTILVVEDTREVVMMLVDYLEMSGFKMITAQDGTDGIQQAKLFHPNLILMDVMMPGMDGFETARRLRMDPEFQDTPIIALTALAMPSDRQRCLDAGMDEYISKPVNLKALVKLIQNILVEKDDTKSK